MSDTPKGYGPNKDEKWELGSNLLYVSVGSSTTTVSLISDIPWIILLILPGLGILSLGAILAFNWAMRLSLRIRIEESQEKSDLIEKIVAIYQDHG